MKKCISILTTIMILLAPIYAWAATYYVSQKSAGAGNGSSYTNRMSVSTHNYSSFRPGDTIYLCDKIRSKVYPPSSGNKAQPIEYKGDYPGHYGILDFSGNPQFKLDGRDFLIIKGLELTNGVIGICSLGSSDYITIKKCEIHNMKQKGIHFHKSTKYYSGPGVSVTNTNIVVGGALGDGNDIHDVGVDTGGSDVQIANTDEFVISYNKLYATGTNYGIDGIATHWASNGIIEHNEIYGHNRYSNGEDGIDLKEESNNIAIRFNLIFDHHYQSGVTIQRGSNNIRVYGNTIHDNYWPGIHIKQGSWENGTEDVSIWANYIYNNSSGIDVNSHGGGGVNNVVICNNVISNNGPGFLDCHTGIGISCGSGHVVKNNMFCENTTGGSENRYRQVYISSYVNAELDYNLYSWNSQKSYIHWDGANRTLATLKKVYYQESNGSEGCPEDDYRFTDPNKIINDFANDSPCIDADIEQMNLPNTVVSPRGLSVKILQ